MPYQDVMNVILPKQGNHSAHITGHYGEHRAKGLTAARISTTKAAKPAST